MQDKTVRALRHALPYLKLFRGKTFVIKCGGEAIESANDIKQILEQISVLRELGIKIVLVHGGGPQATELADKLGVTSTMIEGRRVTDAEMLDAMVMALNGTARSRVLATCRELDISAVGLSGIDASLVEAEQRPPVKTLAGQTVDYGLVGKITGVNAKPVEDLLESGYLPIVSPLAADSNGQILNINADSVASALAVALGAMKLVLITSTRGILKNSDDPQSLISHLCLKELEALEESGTINKGMLPKKKAIEDALVAGVDRVHVVSYRYADSILTEVFTNEGCGTLITLHEDHHDGD